MLKPIETTYNGHRFRSRLEARWAVFLTVLGVPYDYEPEGYTFEEHKYLPDFWIASWDVFVEIKPFRPNSIELERYVAFAQHAEKSLLLFYGNASAEDHRVLWCSPEGYKADDLQLACCRSGCGQMFMQSQTFGAQPIAPTTEHDCWDYPQHHPLDRWPVIWDKLREAFDAAQGARFEFGEAWHPGLPRNEAQT